MFCTVCLKQVDPVVTRFRVVIFARECFQSRLAVGTAHSTHENATIQEICTGISPISSGLPFILLAAKFFAI
jgi:hypothetical protein